MTILKPPAARTRTEVTYAEQFSDSAVEEVLPRGFIAFHTRELCKYFQLRPQDFPGKSVLETGAGPGKHAAILHRLGATVTAVDLLEANVQAMRQRKQREGLTRLTIHQADLMQPLPASWGSFDLLNVYNWVQHAQDPGRVLTNLTARLRRGGRLHLSVYGAGTFVGVISQIARSLLRWEDRDTMKRLIPLVFPQGFGEFHNPDRIYFENILDDFFVPYRWTFRQDTLCRFLHDLGLDVLVPHQGASCLASLDQEELQMGLIKRRQPSTTLERLEKEVDAFDTEGITDPTTRRLLSQSADLARHAIDRLQARAPWERAAFCLGLYRLRGVYSQEIDGLRRHAALQAYLQRVATGNTTEIRFLAEQTRYYQQDHGRSRRSRQWRALSNKKIPVA